MANSNGFFARRSWVKAQNKVNQAVNVFHKHGLGFSISDGVVGDTSALTKSELKKVNNATAVMKSNSAGYYRNAKSFKPKDALHTTRNVPLNLADYRRVQKKSAEMYFKSSHLKSGIKFLQRILFDAKLEAHPNRRRLKLDSNEIQEWAASVEAEWRTDKHEKDWDWAGENNYPQLSDIALLEYLSIGEYFAIRRPDRALLSGFSIQLISPFQVGSPLFSSRYMVNCYSSSNELVRIPASTYLSSMPNGHYVSSGIEYDSKGKKIAIYISPGKISDGWTRVPMRSNSGFLQVLHGFIQQQPGQTRGIPEAAMAYHEFMDIKDLQMFELESAKINATIAGTVTSDSNATPNGMQPMDDVGWSDQDKQLPESSSLPEYQDPNYSVRKVENGGFIVQSFSPGYKYSANDTKRPNVNNAIFIEKELEYILPAAFGVSVVCARQRFDGSYNASKGAIDLTWKQGVEYYLKQFSSDWHKPNYDAWLTAKVGKGQVTASGYEDRYLRSAWQSATIITPPKPSLNPLQEAKAASQKVAGGFSNRELESQQLTGTSAEENTERLERENERLKIANEPLEDTEEV